ncbi:MAG: hypothetical protein JW929_11130 [Anaerolineales bacterium]|nr:hypothetical protein [Anaerolineales bacterium]
MKKNIKILPLVFTLLAGFACITPTPAPSPDDLVGSAVAATQSAIGGGGAETAVTPDGGQPLQTPAAATATGSAEVPATPEPACQPVHPGPQELPLPAAVAAVYEEVVRFKDVHDQTLATRPVGGMTFASQEFAHLAGSLGPGADALPIVYFSLQGGGTLRTNINNLQSDLAPAADLTSLIGAEGNPFIVYVTLDWMNQSVNRVFAGNYAAAASLTPALTWTPDPSAHIGNSIRPLAVRLAGGTAAGFWYTYTMEGIGNINFPPYNGLFYFDLSTLQSAEYIGTAHALGGISPDQTRIAYGAGQGGTPGLIRNGVTVRNLVTCQETTIPFNPSSNLGGGWMVFSPDNQLLAWTEASGPSNMEAAFRIRIARTDGASLFDSPIANMTTLLGGEAPDSLRPVGWLANHLLVLEAYLNVINRYVLIVWAPIPDQPLDPVLGAHQSFVMDGNFLGFVYP